MAPQFTLRMNCNAARGTVYDLLADLNTHLQWNGEQQAKDFRVLTLTAPAGTATAGTVFDSTGNIPMSSRLWHDHSTVTVADRPRVFEFRTDGIVEFQDGTRMEASFTNRYEVEAAGEGSRIAYTMRLESLRNGMWRISLPVFRTLVWKFGIPMGTKPVLRNLVRMAEAAERSPDVAPGTAPGQPRRA